MTLGDLILQYRAEHHMSQRQFAMKCGISNGYIAMIEKNENPATGKPLIVSIEKLKAIASAMNMSLNEVMQIAEGETPVSLGSKTDEKAPKGVKRIKSLANQYPDMLPEMQAYIDGFMDSLFLKLDDQFTKGSADNEP